MKLKISPMDESAGAEYVFDYSHYQPPRVEKADDDISRNYTRRLLVKAPEKQEKQEEVYYSGHIVLENVEDNRALFDLRDKGTPVVIMHVVAGDKVKVLASNVRVEIGRCFQQQCIIYPLPVGNPKGGKDEPRDQPDG